MTFRSLLFVPGNNARFIEKSRRTGADIICYDLEDSVPISEKARARTMVMGALGGASKSMVFVRVNRPGSPEMREDLRMLGGAHPDGIVVPKVDGAGQVKEIAAALNPGISIMPSIESALGVVNAYEIASCGRVSALVFGVFDLLHDMGSEYTGVDSAAYARSKIPVDARAAGIPAIDSVWQGVRDVAGLEADCRAGLGMGYAGKSLIHPDQIGMAHGVFAPGKEQLAYAREVVKEYERSAGSGRGATVVSGKMIDEVHYKQAKRLLGMA